MKIQDYIDHLKAIGASFANMEADVIATLSDIEIMITVCQLDENDKVIYGNDYSNIVGEDTTPRVLVTAAKINGVWESLADNIQFLTVCDLEY